MSDPNFQILYDSYYAEKDGKEYNFEIERSSGEIVLFYDTEYFYGSSGSFTLEDAISKSQNIVSKLHGKNIMEEYPISDMKTYTYEVNGMLSVGYVKKLSDEITSDLLIIGFDLQGNFAYYNARYFGQLSNHKDKLTMENYNAAVEAFRKVMPEKYDIYPGTILYDPVGKTAYIDIFVRDSESDAFEHFLINMW